MAQFKNMEGALSRNISHDESGIPTIHLAEALAEEVIPGQSKRGKTLEQVLRHHHQEEESQEVKETKRILSFIQDKNIEKIVLPPEEYKNLRNEKLNNISDRFRMTMVNLCMMAKDGDSVRLCLSNLTFWVEEYATWLDSFSGAEVEPLDERDLQRRRDGIRGSRGNPGSEDNQERKGEEGGSRVGEGEAHSPTPSGEECDGGAQGSREGKSDLPEGGDGANGVEAKGDEGGDRASGVVGVSDGGDAGSHEKRD